MWLFCVHIYLIKYDLIQTKSRGQIGGKIQTSKPWSCRYMMRAFKRWNKYFRLTIVREILPQISSAILTRKAIKLRMTTKYSKRRSWSGLCLQSILINRFDYESELHAFLHDSPPDIPSSSLAKYCYFMMPATETAPNISMKETTVTFLNVFELWDTMRINCIIKT